MANTVEQRKKFRILSIDGGGLKGVFTAYAIQMLEKEHGIRLLDYFDMFTGTSTGSLIAAAILNGESAQSIFDTYADDNSPIFSRKNHIKNTMREAFFPMYSAEAFEQSLVDRFADMKLSDLAKKSGKSFAFFATNFTKAKVAIYPSPDIASVADEYKNQTVLEALRSSSAAPFYFSPVTHPDSKHLLIDGGLWANNPAVYSVNLAVSNLGVKLEDIEVLSFGQTFIEDSHFEIKKGLDLIVSPKENDIAQLILSMIQVNQNAQTYTAQILLGDRFFRYCPEESTPGVAVDKASTKFLNYSKIYWQQNGEMLAKFIKTGENDKWEEGIEKRYN